ncbi:MAG: hypothetical protein ACR2K6_08465 [Solirubrobacterales bacterium]|jgi:hypothetical protein
MATAAKSRSRRACLLAVILIASVAQPVAAPAADQPASEEYVLDLPGLSGSARGEVEGEVAGSAGIVGEGGIDEAGAIWEYAGSPIGLLALTPLVLAGGFAIRSRFRR